MNIYEKIGRMVTGIMGTVCSFFPWLAYIHIIPKNVIDAHSVISGALFFSLGSIAIFGTASTIINVLDL